MGWETVKIGEEQLGRNIPSVSIGHKRLSMNVAACDLINQKKENFQYVQFMTDRQRPGVVAMRFWKYENSDCVPLSRKEDKTGKPVGGLEVVNANLLKSLFGKIADSNSTTKFKVHLEGNYVMVIDRE